MLLKVYSYINDTGLCGYSKIFKVRHVGRHRRVTMINPILFAVLYLSLLNNFDEVRLFFVAETNLEFGLILSVLEHQF